MKYYETPAYRDCVKNVCGAVVDADRLRGRSVLVTGASGMMGSFLTDLLTALGAEVTAAGRDTDRLAERFPNVGVAYYDMAKEIAIDGTFDYVIHAAGYGHPAAFNAEPVSTLLYSVYSTERWLDFCMRRKVGRFLYVSSGEVYGGIDPMNPRACYPVGKQAAECLCACYTGKNGLDTVAVRLCHTFGLGASAGDNRAATYFFRAAANGEDIVLKSSGEALRSYLFSADSAAAILSVLTAGECGKAYDIASPDCTITIAGLARAIADIYGVGLRYESSGRGSDINAGGSPIPSQVLDPSALYQLGWRSRYSIKEGISAMHGLGDIKCD